MLAARRFVILVLLSLFGGATAWTTQQQMDMPREGYRPITLPAKPGASRTVNEAVRDSIEHVLHCQCGGCRHDVFQCRTNDLVCSIAPQMHKDIEAMLAGGNTPTEVVAAFQSVYGEAALMAPLKKGLNLIGYFLPLVAILVAGIVVFRLLQSWTAPKTPVATRAASTEVDASPEELERVQEALRRDA
jgi:cytochrome c-type biogenesis protein CcmH/NrfF